jgi:beta-barrel assembly-enhancing protease
VTVTLGPDALSFFTETGVLIEWPYGQIKYLADEVRNGPARLAHGEERLTIEDSAFADLLFALAPGLKPTGWRAVLTAGIAAGIVVLCGAAIYSTLPFLAGTIAEFVPVAWEERLGDDTLKELSWKRCTDAKGQAALDKLTHRLTAGSNVPYHLQVTVRDVDMVNAFALPGGRIVLLRGLLREAQSADEVAGVLAHELTHTLKRHPTRNLIATEGAALALQVFTGGGIGENAGTLLVALSYSRGAEEEADAGALMLLAQAGIDTAGFASFFERLSKKEEERHEKDGGFHLTIPAYLNTHPATQRRFALAKEHAGHAKQPALSPSEWHALQGICGDKKK